MAAHLEAKTVVEYKDSRTGEVKKRWTKVGVAFVSESGNINVRLDANPVNGELILMPPRERDNSGI